jgi:hypothetical protein
MPIVCRLASQRRQVGIGPVGADVFLREAQAEWPELRPCVDARAQYAARQFGLPQTLHCLLLSSHPAILRASWRAHAVDDRTSRGGAPPVDGEPRAAIDVVVLGTQRESD